ncbi:MAG: hypothetical protein AB7P50_17845 [Alphaproteobacteria bacterium]
MLRATLGIAALAVSAGLAVLATMPMRTVYDLISPHAPDAEALLGFQAFLLGPAAGALFGVGLILIRRPG